MSARTMVAPASASSQRTSGGGRVKRLDVLLAVIGVASVVFVILLMVALLRWLSVGGWGL